MFFYFVLSCLLYFTESMLLVKHRNILQQFSPRLHYLVKKYKKYLRTLTCLFSSLKQQRGDIQLVLSAVKHDKTQT